ncbi:unnamed protein product [Linum trigynum]|uniref:DWNN domain-containing protein n=1 Tax=Linum trigynum TaxID=586398 RepID=A0AAV2EZB6_9ROSI
MGKVSYRFASSKVYSEFEIGERECVSVEELKMAILRSKFKAKKNANPKWNPNGLCLGTDYDLVFTNEQTKEEYGEQEDALIPSGASIAVRRVPGDRRRRWIDTSKIVVEKNSDQEKEATLMEESKDSGEPTTLMEKSSVTETEEEEDFHDFGEDALGLEKKQGTTSGAAISKEEEDMKIKKLVSTPALSQFQGKRKPMCGIGGGSYVWRRNNGCDGGSSKRQRLTVQPDEETFRREIEAILPSSSSSSSGSNDMEEEEKKSTNRGRVPPELHCPLCSKVMKDAVFVTRCCFRSFCDGCIRNRLMTSRSCACGELDVLVDDLVPNVTLRQVINRVVTQPYSCFTNISSSSSSSSSISNGRMAVV